MDIQGAELLALEGAKDSIKFCNSLEIEVSKEEFIMVVLNGMMLKTY